MEGSNDICEWLDGFSQQQMQIWCEDPETNTEKIAGGVMGMGKTYVTYRIMMKQVGRDVVGVRHRYSEFETLRNSLRDRYGPLGIAVPALPPKNVVSNIISTNMKQTFISERIMGLSIFCEVFIYVYLSIAGVFAIDDFVSTMCDFFAAGDRLPLAAQRQAVEGLPEAKDWRLQRCSAHDFKRLHEPLQEGQLERRAGGIRQR